ncbi:endolytic transglycosylase MltG [Marinilabilia sp.]|uniref:endolytic transglycosylase MltG n=1 Tax=Marinilabilia sp. TaxID=2021252 RepID=UPI0025C17534|nr:endolytic transglycosylase MltG [Marinilabilia sp.]
MALKQSTKRNKKTGRKLILFFVIASIIIAIGGWLTLRFQQRIFAPNVELGNKKTESFYIPTNATFEDVSGLLRVSGFLKNTESFVWLAKIKDYPERIHPGHYLLKDGMNNNELVNMLRGGLQTPVKLTFNNVRTREDLAGKVSRMIEADSLSLLNALSDSTLLTRYDFSPETVPAMIIPNTYEIWWNTDAEEFIDRMHREYKQFWNETRLKKAQKSGMTPKEVATLASIVDEETIKSDEKATVAGLYINRLNRGIRLQADPTIKYVLGDFTINRVLSRDLEIDSPYNTYLYRGLPPGPIRYPSVSGIEAVLNHEDHDYLYMCAKDDFSGYHNFAKTLRQHNINAAKYRRALSERRIWR